MATDNIVDSLQATRKKGVSKGINKKPRSQRPKLVLNDTKELVIVKAKMEQIEAAAPATQVMVRRKAQTAQVVVDALPVDKKPYLGKPRGRKTNAFLAAEAALAANTSYQVALAPINGAVSAAAPKVSGKVANEGNPVAIIANPVPVIAKRSPGRPRKVIAIAVESDIVVPVAVIPKRGPGRPAKVAMVVANAIAAPLVVIAKRGPGRPAKVVVESVVEVLPKKRGRKPKTLMLNNEPALTVKLDDYAVFYSQKGLDDYKTLLRFMQEYSVPVKQSIGLLSGVVSTPTEDALTMFKLGRFRIKNLQHAEHAAKLRNSMRKSAPNIYYKATFTNALARVSAMMGFSDKQLQKNMDKFFMGVEKVDTIEGFERQILEIYNTNLPKKDRLVVQFA